MQRRQARLRREYLYKKSLEEQKSQLADNKRKVKNAMNEDKAIPTELRDDAHNLHDKLQFDDAEHQGISSHVDDEYAYAGSKEPKILLTTARNPSSRLGQFAKEMKLVFPNCQRINRGSYVIKEIMEAAKAYDFTDIVLLHEQRGEPDGMIVSHLPYGPTAYFGLFNCVMRHDLPHHEHMSEAYPHLVFENFSKQLGERVRNILKFLFPVPKEESKRVLSFINQNDYISFRHHIYLKDAKTKTVTLKEMGPRFEMRLYQIKMGTLDQAEAQNEWVLRPFMNTAYKRSAIGDNAGATDATPVVDDDMMENDK